MRRMGGLKRWMPYTYWTFLVSTLAIAGLPPTAGFFSKDEILWQALAGPHGAPWLWALGFAGAGLTAFYMFRQVYMTFHGECRAEAHVREHLHESPPVMTVPLVVLAALALVGGFVGVPAVLGGANRFEQWLEPVFHTEAVHAAVAPAAHGAGLEYGLMALSVGIAVAGILLARAMYATRRLSPEVVTGLAGGWLYRIVYNKYYVDELYGAIFVRGTLLLSRATARFDLVVIDGLVNGTARVTTLWSWVTGLFDAYVIDGLVNGIAAAARLIGGRVRRLQTGSINAYLYVIVLAVVGALVVQLW